MPHIDGILMASGFSRRFGEADKLLWPWRGKPLAEYTLALACSLGLRRVFFVTARAEVAALAQGYPVTPLHNAAPQRGMCESVRLGVAASSAEHYLFFACDQPLLNAATAQAVMQQARPGGIAYPEHEGRPGLPALFSAQWREELLCLAPGQHPRDLKRRHPEACTPVPVPDARVLFDIDRAEEGLDSS